MLDFADSDQKRLTYMFIHTAAHYIPEKVVPNQYFTEKNGLTHEWIESRTGISERRKASESENTHTMGIEAAKKVLNQISFPKEEIDLIVGASYSPYDTVATLGHVVQLEVGVNHIPVVTISSACSSFINAVEIVEGYFASGKGSKALVIVAEHNTAYANEDDKVAGHLWGDGAAAICICKERQSENDLQIQSIVSGGAAGIGKGTEGVVLRPIDGGIIMPHGRDVFIHACQYMKQKSEELLDEHGYTVADISYFIPHQANWRISKRVAEEMGLDESKVVSNIQYLGNTGCAGCAIGLSEKWNSYQKGDVIIVTVFGGGYSYGAMLITG